MIPSIKLQINSISNIRLDQYEKDFIFIVNGIKYETSKVVADLISPKILNFHISDPTINEITIDTHHKGDFQLFLNLQQFNEEQFSLNELKFITEVIKQLGSNNIEIKNVRPDIKIENVINLVKNLEKNEEEIIFISKHFNEIERTQKEELSNLSLETLESILRNPNLKIESEDELLRFINNLYLKSHEYSILYEYVYFEYVEIFSIEEFIEIFDYDDLTNQIWFSLSNRLKQLTVKPERMNKKRYKKEMNEKIIEKVDNEYQTIEYKNDDFNGIFNYIENYSNLNLNDEVKVTCSTIYQGDPQQILQTSIPHKLFYTKSFPNSWICIEFQYRKIIPSHYTIKSNIWSSLNGSHLRSWILEGSEKCENWITIDEQNNNEELRGPNFIHTFHIDKCKRQPFKYIRIRQTGVNWGNNNFLGINSIELYGQISKQLN